MMASAFRLDRTYRERFEKVWLWADWPDRPGLDLGIDLVARTSDGGLIAIQCKFYAAEHQITKSDIDSFFTESGRQHLIDGVLRGFDERIIVATSDQWSTNAEGSLDNQTIPVIRIGVDELDQMTIDWDAFDPGSPSDLVPTARHELRPHQTTAVDKVRSGFSSSDRGQLVMACGTGKTFTSLRIAEEHAGKGATVLFLAPSIALISQTLKEWTAQTKTPIRPFAICSDTTAGRPVEGELGTPYDLAVPPTTDAAALQQATAHTPRDDAMTVIFSTYQSIAVAADLQAATGLTFDLVVCDEAHRTAGTTEAGEDATAFVTVHDNELIPAAKRLYMTATPRVYKPAAKTDATEHDVIVASMDDPEVFGPEFHRLGFGQAVSLGLLADYRVLIMTVGEDAISESFQDLLSTDGNLNLPDVAKIVGCLAGLGKRRGVGAGAFSGLDEPMRRAVAFWSTIAESQQFAEQFDLVAERYVEMQEEEGREVIDLRVPTRHVDGTTNIRARRSDIRWLKGDPADDECRVLTNAKCLTEGVDVPALDAVMFLKPKRSTVDIVQAVGRVMRKPPGKQMGYIILPVVVPTGQSAETVLESNTDYDVVWSVLQALRSHDERFNSYINRIQYLSDSPSEDPDNPIQIVDVDADLGTDDDSASQLTFGGFSWQDWTAAIYTRIVKKVGTRGYWEDWAADVADIARRHHQRILDILNQQPEANEAFAGFLAGLRVNLNGDISQDDAIAMLSQHLITAPIFEALFDSSSFALTNPVSQAMAEITSVLDQYSLDTETASLDRFYDSVRQRVEGIPPQDGAARQRIIKDLYGRFFANAFPETAKSLGIVYTPIEIVDFILRAAEAVLAEHFDGASMSDEGVHVLDPFTGTGTFLARLLRSGIIQPSDLARKFANELHANEILLLAYYIAAVNIETTYQQIVDSEEYTPFPGVVLTDTFAMAEGNVALTLDVFPINSDRAQKQRELDIRVIVGNPPYSATGNLAYPALDKLIADTYVAKSAGTRFGSVYDAYIRAIRWASQRVLDSTLGGVVAFVTNGGFIDSNVMDGLRLTLADEFHHVYVYNLRGNQRTAGELSRKEGGKVFGSGSRNTVAITLLVSLPGDPPPDGAQIHYIDIGDYLSRTDKLRILDNNLRPQGAAQAKLADLPWTPIEPNAYGDWINQRSAKFEDLVPLHDDDEGSIFAIRSHGLKSNRDAWNYNSSEQGVRTNVERMLAHYNDQVTAFAQAHPNLTGTQSKRAKIAKATVDRDPTKFSWDRADYKRLVDGQTYSMDDAVLQPAMYRPFVSRHANSGRLLNNTVYKQPRIFPSAETANLAIGVLEPGGSAPFTALMVDRLPDDKLAGAGNAMQFLPRWIYPDRDVASTDQTEPGSRRDGVTNHAHELFQVADPDITKDDIFFIVYAILHHPQYRDTFANDVARSLARIPVPDKPTTLRALGEAGRQLASLHVSYDDVQPWPKLTIDRRDDFDQANRDHLRITKMRYAKKPNPSDPGGRKIDDKSVLVYNPWITIRGIPERAHHYRLGSRSALDWVVDQQRVRTYTKSGITNDPNDSADEHDDPSYLLNLIGRVVTVSMQTLDVIEGLPDLEME
ncbi:DEAD/DEAH box helicase family protein [Nitriliruptoria bacterium AS10]|nr:DEAD/DEAH box helicase family protein [Salsipaludibacter albus]